MLESHYATRLPPDPDPSSLISATWKALAIYSAMPCTPLAPSPTESVLVKFNHLMAIGLVLCFHMTPLYCPGQPAAPVASPCSDKLT
eukprot:9124875-Ditylum_brightwellii.AAC.1